MAAACAANLFFHLSEAGEALRRAHVAYLLGFHLPFGVLAPAWYLRGLANGDPSRLRRLGVGFGRRDLLATLCALALGAALAAFPIGARLAEPGGATQATRLFALLLVASLAEALLFLGVLGNLVEQRLGGGRRAMIGAALASSVAFGAFHFTFAPPWNTAATAVGLGVVWLGVAGVFFASRSLLAAACFDNSMALIGFVQREQDLPGSALEGWLRAALAGALFLLVARARTPTARAG